MDSRSPSSSRHFDLGEAGNIIFNEDNLAGREELSNRMMSYWVQFAATGYPGRGRDGSLPHWTAWDPAEGAEKFIVFDSEAGGGLRMSSESVTQASVAAAATSDAAIVAREDRCALLANIVAWSDEEVPTDCADRTPNVASGGDAESPEVEAGS